MHNNNLRISQTNNNSSSTSISSQIFDFLFKFIVVGDSGVGKTCLLSRLTTSNFLTHSETTIGIEFGSSFITVEDKRIKLQIWDTAGQESFRSISRAYYRNAIGCILVYDVTRPETFQHIQSWLLDVSTDSKCILIANKCEVPPSQRLVSSAQGAALAQTNGMLYSEASAKSGLSVPDLFISLGRAVFTSLRLNRDIGQFSDAEIRDLERIGVKVGPRRTPMIQIHNSSSSRNEGDGCC